MTQQVFGALLGVTGAFISEIETGAKNPSLTLLMLIEARFGVKLTDERTHPVAYAMREGRVPYDAYSEKIKMLLDAVIEIMTSDSEAEKTALRAGIASWLKAVRTERGAISREHVGAAGAADADNQE